MRPCANHGARMNKLAQALVEHSRWVLAGTGILTLLAVGMLTQIRFDADITSFLTEGNEPGQEFAALQNKYQTADPIIVLLEREDGRSFRSKNGLKLLLAAKASLA